MIRHLTAAAALLAGTIAVSGAKAETCAIDPALDPYDLDDAAVAELYACIEADMAAAYAKNAAPVASAYRGWAATSTRPALHGTHSERFLNTFANDIAAPIYLQYAAEGVEMPVGAVLAKESFKVRMKGDKKGEAVVGPLFIMTKVAEADAPETAGWVYSAVQPNGQDMKFPQSMCHGCHAGFEAQDYLAYPMEEVRLPAGN